MKHWNEILAVNQVYGSFSNIKNLQIVGYCVSKPLLDPVWSIGTENDRSMITKLEGHSTKIKTYGLTTFSQTLFFFLKLLKDTLVDRLWRLIASRLFFGPQLAFLFHQIKTSYFKWTKQQKTGDRGGLRPRHCIPSKHKKLVKRFFNGRKPFLTKRKCFLNVFIMFVVCWVLACATCRGPPSDQKKKIIMINVENGRENDKNGGIEG